MNILPVNSDVNCSFGIIKLPKSKKVEADKIIRAYAKDNNINTRDALVEVYRAAIEKHAANRFIGKAFGDDYKQDLFLGLLTKVEDIKKYKLHPSMLLNKYLNSIKPVKTLFEDDFTRLDFMKDKENIPEDKII